MSSNKKITQKKTQKEIVSLMARWKHSPEIFTQTSKQQLLKVFSNLSNIWKIHMKELIKWKQKEPKN